MNETQHTALYRKYRPEHFNDVVGQENVVELLSKQLKQKKLAHAYLFYGGRGTGKTTVARIFAREAGCSPSDIIEIDAASNRGIDEIRELREAVRSMPFSSPYKVYIVDEAHMLTKEAANALLKTLEEPPAHVIFILATTDPEKLPHTIVSRCQKIEFRQPSLRLLVTRLSHVAHEEGKKLDDDAGLLIAAFGKGSYRDALGVLEQVIVRISETSIKKDKVREILGAPHEEYIVNLLESICNSDVTLMLKTLSHCKEKGIDASILYKELLEYFRLALLTRIGEKDIAVHPLPDVEEKINDLAKTYAKELTSSKLLKLMDQEKYLSLSFVNQYTALEMILLEYIGE